MRISPFLLIPGLFLPGIAHAESVWLVYGAQHSSVHRGTVIDKIRMKNEQQCLIEGPKLEFLIRPSKMSNRDFTSKIFDDVTWGCIKGN